MKKKIVEKRERSTVFQWNMEISLANLHIDRCNHYLELDHYEHGIH